MYVHMTVYLITVETKMYLEMFHLEKQGPSKDGQEKWENFDLSVGLTVDTWELLSFELCHGFLFSSVH